MLICWGWYHRKKSCMVFVVDDDIGKPWHAEFGMACAFAVLLRLSKWKAYANGNAMGTNRTHTHIQPMDVISCVADSININRNWRFRFIAHYYWFLLHSLTKAIENQKDRCYIFFLFCCVSLQFPLEMPTHNRKSERKNNLRNTNRLHSSNGMLFVHKRKSWVSVCFSWLILLWNGIYVSIYP